MVRSLRDEMVSLALGGLLIAKVQWTAKWSEITGSFTDKFKTHSFFTGSCDDEVKGIVVFMCRRVDLTDFQIETA